MKLQSNPGDAALHMIMRRMTAQMRIPAGEDQEHRAEAVVSVTWCIGYGELFN